MCSQRAGQGSINPNFYRCPTTFQSCSVHLPPLPDTEVRRQFIGILFPAKIQKQSKSSEISGQSADRACPSRMEAILVKPVRTALRLPKFAVVITFTLDILVIQEHCVFCLDSQGGFPHLMQTLRNILCLQNKINSSWFQTFAVFWMLYSFFWAIPRLLNFIFPKFRNILFHLCRWSKPADITHEVGTESSHVAIQTPGYHPPPPPPAPKRIQQNIGVLISP